MSLFILDTAGDQQLLKKPGSVLGRTTRRALLDDKVQEKIINESSLNEEKNTESDEEEDYFGLPPPNVDLRSIINESLASQSIDTTRNNSEHEMSYATERLDAIVEKAAKRGKKKVIPTGILDHSDFNPLTNTYDADDKLVRVDVNRELGDTIMKPGLEQVKGLPTLGFYQQRKINRLERAKTKGADWYGLPATEMTEEVETDLKILQMRSVLNPKQFYKKNDLKVLPKYFQIGTVLHSPLDYYNERHTRRNKKKTLVDELLADAQFQQFNRRKYQEIVARRDYYSRRKALKKLKKQKK